MLLTTKTTKSHIYRVRPRLNVLYIFAENQLHGLSLNWYVNVPTGWCCLTEVVERKWSDSLEIYSPKSIVGDGNCLYRAASLAIFGAQEMHDYLRLKTAIQIIQNRELYDEQNDTFVLKGEPVLIPAYNDVVRSALTNGRYAELVHTLVCFKCCSRHNHPIILLPQTIYGTKFTSKILQQDIRAFKKVASLVL